MTRTVVTGDVPAAALSLAAIRPSSGRARPVSTALSKAKRTSDSSRKSRPPVSTTAPSVDASANPKLSDAAEKLWTVKIIAEPTSGPSATTPCGAPAGPAEAPVDGLGDTEAASAGPAPGTVAPSTVAPSTAGATSSAATLPATLRASTPGAPGQADVERWLTG